MAPRLVAISVWVALACAMVIPIGIAANSPWLAGRGIPYIVAGFAGIAGLALLLVQPLLAAGYLPGLTPVRGRWLHRVIGAGIAVGVVLHVAGLYVTSPPDTMDALLLVSPTPFSVYGVIAMWGVVLTVILVAARRWIGWRPGVWRIVHNGLAVVVVVATVIHALMIEGTMGQGSKRVLCVLVLAVTLGTIVHLRVIRPLRRSRP